MGQQRFTRLLPAQGEGALGCDICGWVGGSGAPLQPAGAEPFGRRPFGFAAGVPGRGLLDDPGVAAAPRPPPMGAAPRGLRSPGRGVPARRRLRTSGDGPRKEGPARCARGRGGARRCRAQELHAEGQQRCGDPRRGGGGSAPGSRGGVARQPTPERVARKSAPKAALGARSWAEELPPHPTLRGGQCFGQPVRPYIGPLFKPASHKSAVAAPGAF